MSSPGPCAARGRNFERAAARMPAGRGDPPWPMSCTPTPQLAALYERLYPRSADVGFYLPLDHGGRARARCRLRHRRAAARGARAAVTPGVCAGSILRTAMLAQARSRDDIDWVCGDLTTSAWARGLRSRGHDRPRVPGVRHRCRAARGARRRAPGAELHGRFAFETRNPAARAWESWHASPADRGRRARCRARTADAPGVDAVRRPSVTFTETFSSPGWAQARVSRSTLRFLDAAGLGRFLAKPASPSRLSSAASSANRCGLRARRSSPSRGRSPRR